MWTDRVRRSLNVILAVLITIKVNHFDSAPVICNFVNGCSFNLHIHNVRRTLIMISVIRKYKKSPLFLLLAFLIAFLSCDKEEEFEFNIDDLVMTSWGIPQMIRPPQDMSQPDLSAPTIFYPEGYVTIGPDRTDFWSVRGSRTIMLEEARELWFFLNLEPDKMHVEKTRQTDGALLGEFIYYPLD